MSDFANELKSTRGALGYKTARAFYDWLKERGVSFNYSYYMRLEQAGLPSEKVTQEIASVLRGEWADRLILAHCRCLFPKNTYLFEAPAPKKVEAEPPKPYAPSGQKELSLKQVAVIAASKTNYHIFLAATLARKIVKEKEFLAWFNARELSASLKQLRGAGLVRITEEGFEAVSVESRFPDAYNTELKAAYAKFDLWDEEFGARVGLDFLVNKMLIRRVSGRYLVIIRKQLDLLFELVKSSDETDIRYNDHVLQLKVALRQGKLPG
jgi:hypothetical protein